MWKNQRSDNALPCDVTSHMWRGRAGIGYVTNQQLMHLEASGSFMDLQCIALALRNHLRFVQFSLTRFYPL